MFAPETKTIVLVFDTSIVANLNHGSVQSLTAILKVDKREMLRFNKGSTSGFDGAITVDPTDLFKCSFFIDETLSAKLCAAGDADDIYPVHLEVTLKQNTGTRIFRVKVFTVGVSADSTGTINDLTINVEPPAVTVEIGTVVSGETDPTVPNYVKAITALEIAAWNSASAGTNSESVTASENIAAGDFVNYHIVSGNKRMRKANATDNTKPADAFVLLAVTSGASGTAYTLGSKNTALSGLTPGADYFLSTTNGLITSNDLTTAGNIVQCLGKAESATALRFINQSYYELS